jgi:hypothetical protein
MLVLFWADVNSKPEGIIFSNISRKLELCKIDKLLAIYGEEHLTCEKIGSVEQPGYDFANRQDEPCQVTSLDRLQKEAERRFAAAKGLRDTLAAAHVSNQVW